MGPLGVIGLEPGLGELPHLVEGVEEIRVEDFFPKAARRQSAWSFGGTENTSG